VAFAATISELVFVYLWAMFEVYGSSAATEDNVKKVQNVVFLFSPVNLHTFNVQ
jgi:hypothetical protein